MARSPAPVLSPAPSLFEVRDALLAAMAASAFVDLRYERQKPVSKSPSALAQRADTLFVGPFDQYKAWLGPVSSGAANLWLTKEGRLCLRFRTMNRKVKSDGGELSRWYNGKGEYCWRSLLLEGIKLHTVEVVCGGKRYKLFPNVPAPVI